MTIKRLSKCIYTINGTKYDTRKIRPVFGIKFTGLHSAIWQYINDKHLDITDVQQDKLVCKIMNNNIKAFEALQYQQVATS